MYTFGILHVNVESGQWGMSDTTYFLGVAKSASSEAACFEDGNFTRRFEGFPPNAGRVFLNKRFFFGVKA